MPSESETSERQDQRACDACIKYGFGFLLPGEYENPSIESYWSERLPEQPAEEQGGMLCILHHRDTTKDSSKVWRAVQQKIAAKDFDFRGVRFPGAVGFSGDLENANFSGAIFYGEARFLEAIFSGSAEFSDATFKGKAYFSGEILSDEFRFTPAIFDGDANFYGAIFEKEAIFSRVTFGGRATFADAIFDGDGDFLRATFRDKANFFGTTFGGDTSFALAGFDDEAVFRSLIKSGDNRKVHLELFRVSLRQPEKIHFQDVDMENVGLLGTEVRKVQFTKVDWPEQLRDEREADERMKQSPKKERPKTRKGMYRLVEKLYRQLRQNLEDNGNYPEAGQFYYGEMEMRRKSKPWWQRYCFSLTALYWLSSGYGQRFRQAGLWGVLLFVLFGWLYMLAGLQGPREARAVVDSTWDATWAAFLHAAEVLTFAREKTYGPVNALGRWLGIAQTILIPLQLALFTLAVRRSFRR